MVKSQQNGKCIKSFGSFILDSDKKLQSVNDPQAELILFLI